MHTLNNKLPPPLVALIFAAIMWFSAPYLPKLLLSSALQITLTALVLLMGISFCIAGVLSFKRHQTTVNPLKPETASALVNSGVYRISRNPMYLGFAFGLTALSVYLLSPVTLVGVLGFIAYMNAFQITPEEQALTQLFGDDFKHYQSHVRRWL